MSNKSGEFGEEIGLGDLPEDISEERARVADLTEIKRRPTNRDDAIGDVRYQDAARRTQKSLGTVPYSGEVISTFDSRPINAIDFSSTTLETWPVTGTASDASTVTSVFTPPGGYIAVLRGYRYEMQPVVPIDIDDLLLDILVNNVSQLGYRSLMHGQVVSEFIPCFILADAGFDFEIKLRAPNGINAVTGDSRKVIVEVYGNLIQTTGAPLALEIANKEIGLPIKTQQSVSQDQKIRNRKQTKMTRATRQRLRRQKSGFERFRIF